jgi:hypothetical protein
LHSDWNASYVMPSASASKLNHAGTKRNNSATRLQSVNEVLSLKTTIRCRIPLKCHQDSSEYKYRSVEIMEILGNTFIILDNSNIVSKTWLGPDSVSSQLTSKLLRTVYGRFAFRTAIICRHVADQEVRYEVLPLYGTHYSLHCKGNEWNTTELSDSPAKIAKLRCYADVSELLAGNLHNLSSSINIVVWKPPYFAPFAKHCS